VVGWESGFCSLGIAAATSMKIKTTQTKHSRHPDSARRKMQKQPPVTSSNKRHKSGAGAGAGAGASTPGGAEAVAGMHGAGRGGRKGETKVTSTATQVVPVFADLDLRSKQTLLAIVAIREENDKDNPSPLRL